MRKERIDDLKGFQEKKEKKYFTTIHQVKKEQWKNSVCLTAAPKRFISGMNYQKNNKVRVIV